VHVVSEACLSMKQFLQALDLARRGS
jgi:hypothetical protein